MTDICELLSALSFLEILVYFMLIRN